MRKPASVEQTRERLIQWDADDTQYLRPIADCLAAMRTDRSRLLALAFFVSTYSPGVADGIYTLATHELDRSVARAMSRAKKHRAAKRGAP